MELKEIMKRFYCDGCGMMLFFKNNRCLKCNRPLGFLPDILRLSLLESQPNNLWQPLSEAAGGSLYRQCRNGVDHQACNWLVPEQDPQAFCIACRLNEVIPNLAEPKNLERWSKLELAKRRCVYTLRMLGLRLEGTGAKDSFPLRFRFLQDQPGAPVMTGHENGVITVNVVEADDDEREHRRLALHEPYRTIIGHLRHETGHLYWDRLIANTPSLAKYRELFGDETADYDAALKKHYENGAPPNWPERTVTAYASSHPWEDWAETWAHYLHIMETLETSASYGLAVPPLTTENHGSTALAPLNFNPDMAFDDLMVSWTPLTCALNSINRGMGLHDLYPFVISPAVVDKLRFIHETVKAARQTTT